MGQKAIIFGGLANESNDPKLNIPKSVEWAYDCIGTGVWRHGNLFMTMGMGLEAFESIMTVLGWVYGVISVVEV